MIIDTFYAVVGSLVAMGALTYLIYGTARAARIIFKEEDKNDHW